MHKLTLIAAALVASQAVNAAEVFKDDASSVDLYGRVYAGYVAGDKDGESDNYGSNSYIRIGAKAKSSITDSVDAFARYEAQFGVADNEKQEQVKTRLAYAGVKGDFGAVSFGRDYGSTYLVTGWTDISFTDPYGNAAVGVAKNDNIGRTSNLLKYAGSFGGVDIQAGYKFRDSNDLDHVEDDGTKVFADKDNSAMGLSAAYNLDFGLSIGAGYNVQSRGDADDDSKLMVAGLNYESDFGLWAALVYATGEYNESFKVDGNSVTYYEHTGMEAALGYKITKAFRAQVLWNQAEGKLTEGADTTDITDHFLVGVRYDLNKNMRLVAEYQINNMDNAENELAFAARYDF